MKSKIKNKNGSVLAYALIIVAIVSIILVSILQYISAQIRFGFNRVNREKSLQVAEAGIFFYRWYLAHEISGKTAQQIKAFWESGSAYGVSSAYEAEFYDPEGGAVGKYRLEVEPPDSGSTIVVVKSTGWTYKEPDVQRIVQVRFRRPSWSEYAVLANDVMRFGTGTEIFGKVHSNNGIRFDGFTHNVMTSSVYSYDDPDHSGGQEFGVHTHLNPIDPLPPAAVPNRTNVFEAGRQFPVPTIDFNSLLADLNFMKSESQIVGQGRYFDNTNCSGANYGRHIVLKNNDTMTVTTVRSYNTSSNSITSEGCSQDYPIPNGGIIFVENNVWLEGTVDGQRITVVAANLLGGDMANMYLGMNNLEYTHQDGQDIIGVFAQRNVEIIRESQNFLTIDGALLAQNGRVGREHYGTYCVRWWWWGGCREYRTDRKDTITVNGSIATNLRYGFAWTDGTGYTNRILNFDNNLLYYPPPYFPTGTEYSIDLWDEL